MIPTFPTVIFRPVFVSHLVDPDSMNAMPNQQSHPGAKFAYVDMYISLLGLINNPQASGFTDVADGYYIPKTSPIP
ncbi:hypothetical protein Bca52824_072509 [Brassica carinata]|uniref:Uncharacterized protein n=1 Tax=Brassica carinata TaxID=52824 RepID=A0A8X7Q889_BRACI|nr:hypothetical protein Bca52824_072509 [Brassica carinata]